MEYALNQASLKDIDLEVHRQEIELLRHEVAILSENNKKMSDIVKWYNEALGMNSDLRLGLRDALNEAHLIDLAKTLLSRLFNPSNWVRENGYLKWIGKQDVGRLKAEWESVCGISNT